MIGNATTSFDQALLNKSRQDKFVLVFNIPKLLRSTERKFDRSNNTIQMDTLQFSIYGTVVPRIQVPATTANYSGSVLQISSQARPAYSPITVNFTIDNQFNNYWVIYTWLNALRESSSGLYATAVDKNKTFSGSMLLPDYSTDFTIFGKDEFNNDIIKWVYKSAFPTTLGEINFNYRTANEIDTSFEFVFSEVSCELL